MQSFASFEKGKMSKLRNISREGWMVFTAVLTAIAVVAAMVTVPGMKAEAAEPTDFKPNFTLNGGPENEKTVTDPLVWAGPAPTTQGSKNNDVGWGWCLSPTRLDPMNINVDYLQTNAVKADVPAEHYDAVINIAKKWQEKVVAGDLHAAVTYSVYLIAFIGDTQIDRSIAADAILGNDPQNHYPSFRGSPEEFQELTGLEIVKAETPSGPRFNKVAEIPKQPSGYFLTIVKPAGTRSGAGQTVLPPDQPGLPGDESDLPKISTNADFANGATEVVAG
ncbi:hypothetical protein QP363_12560, partial [Corynebacterium sp. UMB6689]|nr:hypothetical protein [Corynebacterium sp. UMB6689]